METVLLTFVLFCLAFVAMAVGVIIRGKSIDRTCATAHHPAEESDCSCARTEAGLCPSGDPLVKLAQASHPDPHHNRGMPAEFLPGGTNGHGLP